MAILFAGGEPGDFEFSKLAGGVGVNSSMSYRDATYSRVGTWIYGDTQLECPIPPTSEIWAAGRDLKDDSYTDDGYVLFEVSSATGPVMRIEATGADNGCRLMRWDGAAWVTVQTINSAFTQNTVEHYVFHVVIGVSGAMEWYRNGNLQASYYGDTSALGDPTYVGFGAMANFPNTADYWSEIIVASHDISAARLKTMNLTAAGDLTEWGGAYTSIEATNSPDETFIDSGTAGQTSTFQADNLAADTLDVAAVVLSGRVRKSSTGPTGINGVVRLGTTNYTRSLGTLSTALEPRQVIWETDPSTTVKWLRADVDALQVGVESVA